MGQSPIAFVARNFQKAFTPGQVDQQGALWSSDRHSKHYASCYGTPAIISPATAAQAGALFRGANQSAASLSAGLATTYTGLCLNNPATVAGATPLNLVLKRVTAMFNASDSAAFVGLITGWLAAGITVHTTPLDTSILPGYIGAATSAGSITGPVPIAHLDAACTLVGTPIWDRWIGATPASTVATIVHDFDEDMIIPPGGYVAIGSSAAEGSTPFVGSFMWEQLPQ